MMTRRGFAGWLGAAAVSGLSGCGNDIHEIRYRLTLDVETPEGTKSGSSVFEQIARMNDGIFRGLGAGPGITIAWRGEAVIIDLGFRRMLFCLLRNDTERKDGQDIVSVLQAIFPMNDRGTPREHYVDYLDRLRRLKPRGSVPLAATPLLVRFRDVADPKSVERVDPFNLAASFGPGVRLAGLKIEVTDAPVTGGKIEAALPWLTWPRERLLEYGGGLNPVRINLGKTTDVLGDVDFIKR